jgi:hypothetical protein
VPNLDSYGNDLRNYYVEFVHYVAKNIEELHENGTIKRSNADREIVAANIRVRGKRRRVNTDDFIAHDNEINVEVGDNVEESVVTGGTESDDDDDDDNAGSKNDRSSVNSGRSVTSEDSDNIAENGNINEVEENEINDNGDEMNSTRVETHTLIPRSKDKSTARIKDIAIPKNTNSRSKTKTNSRPRTQLYRGTDMLDFVQLGR